MTDAPACLPCQRRAGIQLAAAAGMVVDDQSAVIALLASPSTHGGMPVDRIDTHTAIVFLAGDRAYKLKRAVQVVRRATCPVLTVRR